MRNAIAIAKKELNIYFATPVAYVMLTAFVIIGSYFFLRLLGAYQDYSMRIMQMQNPEAASHLNFQDAIFRNLFGNLGVILIFIIPVITMRLIAEEKKQRTIELLYTTPVSSWEIVAGKFAAALSILLLALLFTMTYPVLVQFNAGDANGVDWRSVLLGYLGLFLLGGAYIAIGLFISALTDSQPVAAVLTFCALLMTWIVSWMSADAQGWVRDLVIYLASVSHLDSFSKGTIDLKDLAYFLSVIALFLFTTNRAVEAHRWS